MQRKFISRRSFLKCAGVGAVTAAAAGLLAGCGGSDSSSSGAASPAAPAEPADPNKPYAGVTLYYAATDTEATGPEMQDIVAMVKEKTGINIEFNIIPKADTGEVDKRLVSLQAGDALDIVYGTVAQLKVFYDAGVLEPLDEMAGAAGYDIKSVFGDSAPVYDDGQTYGLPALGRTGLYTLIYVPVIMVLSFILAYLLNKGVFWAKGIRSMFFLPYVSNMVAVAVVFQLMLGPRGPFYLLQKFFGVEDPIIPLLNQKWALPVVVLIAVWKGIGLNFLTYLGALQNVDKSQVKAAEIDGANKWQQIKNVVIPAVAPTTFFLTNSSIITSLQNFTVIQSLTDGGPGQATTVMSLNIVNTAFVKYETNYAAAQALVMFAIVMVITLIQWRGQKKWADQ